MNMFTTSKKVLIAFLLGFFLTISYSCDKASVEPIDQDSPKDFSEEIVLSAEEQKVADRLLQNEVFKGWIKSNDEFSQSILQKLRTLNKKESEDLIANYKSSRENEEQKNRNFYLQLVTQQEFDSFRKQQANFIEYFSKNRWLFRGVNERINKVVVTSLRKQSNTRVEEEPYDTCGYSHDSCAMGVLHTIEALCYEQVLPASVINGIQASGMASCYGDFVRCLNNW